MDVACFSETSKVMYQTIRCHQKAVICIFTAVRTSVSNHCVWKKASESDLSPSYLPTRDCVYILQRWMACSFNIPTRHGSTRWLLLQSCFNTDKLLLRGGGESNALSISFISVLRSTGPPDETVRIKKVYEVVTFSPLFKCLDILWVSHLPVEAVLRTLYTLTAKLIEGTL